jgi:hypothetical protein
MTATHLDAERDPQQIVGDVVLGGHIRSGDGHSHKATQQARHTNVHITWGTRWGGGGRTR